MGQFNLKIIDQHTAGLDLAIQAEPP